MLHLITALVNGIAMLAAIWLGLFLVTRSPRSKVSWLTALTLFSISGLLLNIFAAIYPPPPAMVLHEWAQWLFPFWPAGVLGNGTEQWLQGWTSTPAVAFWHHATVLLRPGPMTLYRRMRIVLGYLVAVIGIVIQISIPDAYTQILGDPLYLNALKGSGLYTLFLVVLLALLGLSTWNLIYTYRFLGNQRVRKQYRLMLLATLVASLVVPVGLVTALLDVRMPMVMVTVPLAGGMLLIGYGVASYSAFMQGRTIRRDFVYNALSISLVTILYALLTGALFWLYNLPAGASIFILVLVVFTHSAVDASRSALDRLFYRRSVRQFRLDLRNLSGQISQQDMPIQIQHALKSLRKMVNSEYVLVLLFEPLTTEEQTAENLLARLIAFTYAGSRQPPTGRRSWPARYFLADDVLLFDASKQSHDIAGEARDILGGAALLIPLYVETRQIGALLFGPPRNGIEFAQSDVERLLEPADSLGIFIFHSQRERDLLIKLTQSMQANLQTRQETNALIPPDQVEIALRNLFNYSYLADLPLASVIMGEEYTLTHIERGRRIYEYLLNALDQLRPCEEPPEKCEALPREWYPYTILTQAYVEGVPNREIMNSLYISEGTFNRTRREAIRSLVRILNENQSGL